jgi:hypothetical protein
MPTARPPSPPPVPGDSPTTRPTLPIVRLGDGDAQLEVLFSLTGAAASAQAFPDDEYHDVRGVRLTRSDDGGALRLEARGEADPAGLQRRLIVATRRAAEAAEGGVTSEVDAVLCWLAAAPSAEHMVHGLGCAPLVYDDDHGIPCHKCNPLQRFFRGDCCPR